MQPDMRVGQARIIIADVSLFVNTQGRTFAKRFWQRDYQSRAIYLHTCCTIISWQQLQ